MHINQFLRFISIFSLLFIAGFGSNAQGINPELLRILDNKPPKEYVISKIAVSGIGMYDENLIISISGIAIGDKVQIPGTDAFSKAITRLWDQKLISDVKIYFTELVGNNLSIEIVLTESPRLRNITFSGIKKSEKEDLEAKMNLVRTRVVTENMKMNAREIIQKHYSDKKFRDASVKVTETNITDLNNQIDLNFDIVKGEKQTISTLFFSGNNNIETAKLKKQMKGTKEKTRMSIYPTSDKNPYGENRKTTSFKDYLKDYGFLSISKTKSLLDPYFRLKPLASAKFSEKKYAEDKERLLNYYQSRGFRDAVIISDTVFVSDTNHKQNLTVALKVDEGRQYYFGKHSWKGNTKYKDSILSLFYGIKDGDIYNLDLLNKKLGKGGNPDGGDISSLYMDDGYLFFSINSVETSVHNDTIDHEFRIVEGPQATYGNITISGNDKTKDYVIRRELRTVPGEKFSRSDIFRTTRELSQLGFFNPEKIVPNVVPNQEKGTVDINWVVEEKSNDQLELSAGWGGNIGLTGTLGVTFNNFSIKNLGKKSNWDPLPSGDGQKLSIRVQTNGKLFRNYNFSFTEPWLGGKKRNAFTVSAYNSKVSNNITGSNFLSTTGVSVSLGRQLKVPDDYFSFVSSINVTSYKLKDWFQLDPDFTNGNSTNINLRLALARNSTGGSPIFPTSGSNFLLSGQFTLPYSLLGISKKDKISAIKLPEYHKWRMNAEWFVPIGEAKGPAEAKKQMVLKLAAKYGFIGGYGTGKQLSPFERFQVGDAGLNNQFNLFGYDIIAHRGYPVYGNSNPKINPTNGDNSNSRFTIFNKYVAELRYPFSTSASSTIFATTWFEAANGWYDVKKYNPFQLRRSAGVGMRFFLPMFGLLGFDYGLGLDRIKPNEPMKAAFKFTFMMGQDPE